MRSQLFLHRRDDLGLCEDFSVRCEEAHGELKTANRTSIIQTIWRALRTLRGLNAVRQSGHKTCPFTIVLWTCVVTHRTQNLWPHSLIVPTKVASSKPSRQIEHWSCSDSWLAGATAARRQTS